VDLGWTTFFLVEKLNENLLFIAHGKLQNIKCTCPSAQDEQLLSKKDEQTIF
jgi:hypothetical protein